MRTGAIAKRPEIVRTISLNGTPLIKPNEIRARYYKPNNPTKTNKTRRSILNRLEV
jgi:hypothetical protein